MVATLPQTVQITLKVSFQRTNWNVSLPHEQVSKVLTFSVSYVGLQHARARFYAQDNNRRVYTHDPDPHLDTGMFLELEPAHPVYSTVRLMSHEQDDS